MKIYIYTYSKVSVNECLFDKWNNFFLLPVLINLFFSVTLVLGSVLQFVDSTVTSSDCLHEAGEKLPRKNVGKSRSHRLQGHMVHSCEKTALWRVE